MANIYYFNNNTQKEKQNSSTKTKIKKYIEQNKNGFYDEDLQCEKDLEVFLQLSELRKGLFCWYDFKEGSEILEIYAGAGALTGLFCEKARYVVAVEPDFFYADILKKRYQNVDNLDIYAGNLKEIHFQQKYDYIILTGTLEIIEGGEKNFYAEYLMNLSSLLKKNGKILISVDNRYGLKYFCGAKDPYSKIPFSSMNIQFQSNKKGYLFSRQELIEILKDAGLASYKFYYPLPDYKVPQIIYSQCHLPDLNIRERLIPYYDDPSTLVMNEKLLYDDIVKNGAFEFLANSFLIECGKDEDFCKVNYAAVSLDRGKKQGFATKIYSDNMVMKAPIYREGMESANHFMNNMADLAKHGIPVVSCKLTSEGVLMPYRKEQTLSNYMKVLIRKDREAFLKTFDDLYEYILKSSEQVPQEENMLQKHLQITECLKWGPILKRAYIELIPLNCFYSEEHKMIFFDQEFVRENYPAKYILYRAIKYVYCFTADAEFNLPVHILKEKYEMTEIWDYFQEEEDHFLKEVRNHERYQQFYNWTKVDEVQMQKNVKKLGNQKQEFVVSDKMKKIWKVELDLLDQLDKVCNKNGLRYFLIYGTLLGAVRHKGFIPWDDDLDITMPRDDYEKLKEIANDEFEFPYFLQTPENDPNTYNNGHLRLRNSNTTGIETKDIGHDCNLGIWIDILALDEGVLTEKQKEKKRKKIYRAQYLLHAKTYGNEVKKFGTMGEKKWHCYVLVSRFFSRKTLCSKLKEAQLCYCSEKSPDLVIYGEGEYRAFSKKDFEKELYLEFCGCNYPVPIGYKHWLEVIMGRDYMKFPSLENRKPKHQGIFDTEKSYKEYNKIFTELFSGADNKQIVLFGAGLMSEDYMKKHGSQYKPEFIVDNDELKWGTIKYGIPIKSPEALYTVPSEKMHLIICSFYYKEIERQLEKMKIQDYHVYIQNTSWIIDAER